MPVTPVDGAIFDLDIHEIPALRNDPAHLHFDVRYVLQAQTERFVISAESHDLAWVDPSLIGTYTQERSILRMIEKWGR